MWVPRVGCPGCGALLEGNGAADIDCDRCGGGFDYRRGILHSRSQPADPDADAAQQQYRVVRGRDGHRRDDPEYYRELPAVPADDPAAAEWRIRRESFMNLRRHVLADRGTAPALRVADLGAGCGWLSHRLAALGHAVAAVDRQTDDEDGLGACRHYRLRFAVLRASYDALPFAARQFDVAVFNASLHYAADPARPLAEARRILTDDGAIVVMDSPMFDGPAAGERMVQDELVRIGRHGVAAPVRIGVGFLTGDGLAAAVRPLGMTATFIASRGPWTWRLRRPLARLRLGRPPARFGIWVAR